MPIKGINRERCTNYKLCIADCPASNYILDEETVIFRLQGCISCGHCIAICPEDAIIFRSMKDEPLMFKGVEDPSTLISYETMHRIMRAKRSMRRFKKDKLPEDLLNKVLNSMRYAPTGSNIQGLKCQIISSEEKIQELSDSILNALVSSSMMPEMYAENGYKNSF